MQKNKLSTKELTAILAVNYEEISEVFSQLPALKKLSDDKERRDRVLADLKALLSKGLGYDPKKRNLYSIFDPKKRQS